jgi:hypothetical protein
MIEVLEELNRYLAQQWVFFFFFFFYMHKKGERNFLASDIWFIRRSFSRLSYLLEIIAQQLNYLFIYLTRIKWKHHVNFVG